MNSDTMIGHWPEPLSLSVVVVVRETCPQHLGTWNRARVPQRYSLSASGMRCRWSRRTGARINSDTMIGHWPEPLSLSVVVVVRKTCPQHLGTWNRARGPQRYSLLSSGMRCRWSRPGPTYGAITSRPPVSHPRRRERVPLWNPRPVPSP